MPSEARRPAYAKGPGGPTSRGERSMVGGEGIEPPTLSV